MDARNKSGHDGRGRSGGGRRICHRFRSTTAGMSLFSTGCGGVGSRRWAPASPLGGGDRRGPGRRWRWLRHRFRSTTAGTRPSFRGRFRGVLPVSPMFASFAWVSSSRSRFVPSPACAGGIPFPRVSRARVRGRGRAYRGGAARAPDCARETADAPRPSVPAGVFFEAPAVAFCRNAERRPRKPPLSTFILHHMGENQAPDGSIMKNFQCHAESSEGFGRSGVRVVVPRRHENQDQEGQQDEVEGGRLDVPFQGLPPATSTPRSGRWCPSSSHGRRSGPGARPAGWRRPRLPQGASRGAIRQSPVDYETGLVALWPSSQCGRNRLCCPQPR